jgi:hypothetical protein
MAVRPIAGLLIDPEDEHLLTQYKWYFHSAGYVCTSRSLLLHRLIMKARKGQVVDHANRNKLDNRKSNLRLCTTSDNNKNRRVAKSSKSGYKGVYWCSQNERWRASINVNSRRIHLGFYDCVKTAALAYNKAAVRYFKQFAMLNEVI